MSEVSHASTHRLEVEQQLREMNDEWTKALVRRDGETLDRVMADDFCFAYPMEGDDKAQFVSDVTSGNVRVEYLNRENVTVHLWGTAAALTATDTVKWFYNEREFSGRYKIVQLYAERGGKWQMVMVQACPIA